MPKTAYRVEHPTSKVGPYTYWSEVAHTSRSNTEDSLPIEHVRVLWDLVHCHSDDTTHPTLWRYLDTQQLRYTEENGALCGCPTLDALRNWFGSFLNRLVEIGFRVVEYDYEEAFQPVDRGHAQLIFIPIGEPRKVGKWC